MNKKTLLVNLPPWDTECPPYKLEVLDKYLESQGISIDIIDLNIELYHSVSPQVKQNWNVNESINWYTQKNINSLNSYFRDHYKTYLDAFISKCKNYDIIAFSIIHHSKLFLNFLLNEYKSFFREKIIIVGGRGVFLPEDRSEVIITHCVDYFIIGEGEIPFSKLLIALNNDNFLFEIEGVVSSGDVENDLQSNHQQGIILQNLNEIPQLDYNKFNLSLYKKKCTTMMSRGCISRCSFCDDCNTSMTFRFRNAELVFNEIKYLYENYNINDFVFNDLLMNGNLTNLELLCDLIIQSELIIKWVCLAIPIDNLSSELLQKMKISGCHTISYGIESGSLNILKAMNKLFTPEQASNSLKKTFNEGINTSVNFIVGYPTELEEDFNQTLLFVNQNAQYISSVVNLNIFCIIDGTSIFKRKDEFDIVFPEYDKDIMWSTKDGLNTYDLRVKRGTILYDFLIKYNINVWVTNFMSQLTKSKEILLINPPPWGVHNPPIGLGYVSQALLDNNYDHDVLDFNLELFTRVPENQKHFWHMNNKNFWGHSDTFNMILKENKSIIDSILDEYDFLKYRAIGFSIVEPRELITNYICEYIKKKNPYVVFFAGNVATSNKDRRNTLKYIDYFVIGEGELANKELMDFIFSESNEKLEDNSNLIVTKENNKYLIYYKSWANVNQLSFPKYEKFPLYVYLSKSLLFEWSRGCIGSCVYCKGKEVMKNFRPRKPEHIFEEIKYHYEINNIRAFTVSDNMFNGNLKYLEKLCDLILESGMQLDWFGEAVTNTKMSQNLFNKLRGAGCSSIQWGVESGSNKVLSDMNRLYRIRDASLCIRRAHKAGIKNEIFMIVGFPTETQFDFIKSVFFVIRHKKYLDKVKSINMLHVIEDTNLSKHPELFNIILPEDDWHYKWTSPKSNHLLRNKRLKYFLDICKKRGIFVQETNYNEGAEKDVDNWDAAVDFANNNVGKH